MTRRRWLLSAVAVAATAAGAGVAWKRAQPDVSAADSAPLGTDFWLLKFEQPAGGELALESLRGAPLLLNFWATWCPPCIKEMPMLDAFYREHHPHGWQVLGLAVDSPTPVRGFLTQRPVAFPIGLAGLVGTELSRTLGNADGGLPYTVVVGRDGRVRDRKQGALSPADLSRWVQQASL
jgi:thiol-disulfide isomerase/thioredoxin